MKEDVLRELERLCKQIGGKWRYDDDLGQFICEDVDEEFLSTHGSEIAKKLAEAAESGLEEEVVFRFLFSKLIGGMEEYADLWYDPYDKEIVLSAEMGSETGVPYGTADIESPWDTEVTLRRKFKGKEITARGDVVDNSATEEFIGWGEASAALKPHEVRRTNKEDLSKLMDEVINLAREVAEEAWANIPYIKEVVE